MSTNRVCPNCFQEENIRFNFGNDRNAERTFHSQKWCSCGYNSPNEMMIDQDLGFNDPCWLRIARYFLENYHLRIAQGEIRSKEELVRFFLKLLKNSASNFHKSIELKNKTNNEYDFIYNGRSLRTPKAKIMDEYSISNITIPTQNTTAKQTPEIKKHNYLNKLLYIIFGIVVGILITRLF